MSVAGRKSLFSDVGEGAWKRKPRSAEADLDITPMIDVTFLLLIFFMVTSTMQATADLDLPVSQHGTGVETQNATVLTIKAPSVTGGDPVLLLGDTDGSPGTIADIPRYVEEGVKANGPNVVIKADREVRHGFVQEVVRAVNSVEGVHFYIGVKDEPHR